MIGEVYKIGMKEQVDKFKYDWKVRKEKFIIKPNGSTSSRPRTRKKEMERISLSIPDVVSG